MRREARLTPMNWSSRTEICDKTNLRKGEIAAFATYTVAVNCAVL